MNPEAHMPILPPPDLYEAQGPEQSSEGGMGRPLSEPDIFAIYGERVVTYFGITKPLQELVDLCPVPPSERDPAKMQIYAARILQTAGVEVEDRFLALLNPHQ